MKVYIAGPYTEPDPAVNTANAMRAWHEVADRGHYPFCPHLSHFLHIHRARPYDEWLAHDLEWLGVCDALLRLPGESSGADEEVAYAVELGLLVVESVSELPTSEGAA